MLIAAHNVKEHILFLALYRVTKPLKQADMHEPKKDDHKKNNKNNYRSGEQCVLNRFCLTLQLFQLEILLCSQ